jgi:hypothetical protein
MNRPLFPTLALLFVLSDTVPAAEVDFSHQIVPVLREFCGECHTGDKKKGGLSFNTRTTLLAGGESGKVVVPGKSADSDLFKRITSADPEVRMPPKGPRVPADKVALVRAWIDAGVPWEEGFAFSKRAYDPPLAPRRPTLPPAVKGRTNPVDCILDAYLAERKLPHPGRLDDAAFYRRVSLDLVGLLPEPDALDRFVRDTRPNKRERLVSDLLADNTAYAEHWLTFWNDLLRNDYQGTGFITGGRKQITGWLYQSLLANKPYDVFVRELVAPGPESDGFIQGIRWRGDVSAGQTQEIQFAQNVAQAFLGINLKCASCHDSFIDHWKLTDAYGLAAVYATKPLTIHRCDKPTGQKAKAAWLFPELGTIDATAPQPVRLKQLAGLVTHPGNGRLSRTIVNRLWHRLMGRGIVHPTDAMHTEPWSADLLDSLAVHLIDNKYDLKKTLLLIATSEMYGSKVALDGRPDRPFVFAGPQPKRMTAEQFLDAVRQVTEESSAKIDAPVVRKAGKLPSRAALMKCDLLMRALGRPNRDQIVSMRPAELTTLEAIDLTNHQALADILDRGAKHLLAKHGSNAEELIGWVYRFALSRAPTAQELAATREVLGTKPTEQGVQDLLWAVFMLPEFQLIR